nr:hypothetical protein CFP56_52494 [Quercus suber]
MPASVHGAEQARAYLVPAQSGLDGFTDRLCVMADGRDGVDADDLEGWRGEDDDKGQWDGLEVRNTRAHARGCGRRNVKGGGRRASYIVTDMMIRWRRPVHPKMLVPKNGMAATYRSYG